MAEREGLITITLSKYKEAAPRFIHSLSSIQDRFSVNFGKISIIVKLWFLRKCLLTLRKLNPQCSIFGHCYVVKKRGA